MKRILVIGFAVSLISNAARGQTTAPPNRLIVRADSSVPISPRDLGTVSVTHERTATDDLKTALRNLVVAEEQYFHLRHEYTRDKTALEIVAPNREYPETEVIFAGKNSWSGSAKAATTRGKSCVMFVGPVKELPKGAPKTLGGVVAKEEGVPVCDDP